MCGICGIATSDRVDVPRREFLEPMVASMHHRGPDGHGIHIEPGVGLGHVRLSIIDLDGGAQPMSIADGRYTISFNGEIYNYKELKKDLLAKGHRFDTESDTEVIMHLYQEMGEACLGELNGMFAFALWDAHEKTLLLARDRMGEKPLYYADTYEGLLFASELKSLRCCSNLKPTLSTRALDDYFAYGYVPSPHTIYEEVKKLPQAHYLVWQDGEYSIKRYWSPYSQRPAIERSTAVEELSELISDAVRLRLRSDVPVGSFLSGGIDSTLITTDATKHYGTDLQSFTIGFDDKSHDESSDAEFTANFLGTRHTTKMLDGMNLDILPTLVRQFDEPFADPSAVPTYFVTHAASEQLKVCLSGDGGDELFGGYSRYAHEGMENMVSSLPLGLRRALFSIPAAVLPSHIRGYGWLERMMSGGAERYQQKIGILNTRERTELFRHSHAENIDRYASLFRPFFDGESNAVESQIKTDLQTYLPDDILVKTDRTSMAHALEVRVPLLDHRIVEYACALPLDCKIRDGEQKWVLKEVLRSKVPAEVLKRKKRGFGLPLCDWFRGEYKEFVAERLLQSNNKIFDFMEPEAVARLVKQHNSGHRDFSNRIWALVWFEEWQRAFGD